MWFGLTGGGGSEILFYVNVNNGKKYEKINDEWEYEQCLDTKINKDEEFCFIINKSSRNC